MTSVPLTPQFSSPSSALKKYLHIFFLFDFYSSHHYPVCVCLFNRQILALACFKRGSRSVSSVNLCENIQAKSCLYVYWPLPPIMTHTVLLYSGMSNEKCVLQQKLWKKSCCIYDEASWRKKGRIIFSLALYLSIPSFSSRTPFWLRHKSLL